MSSRNDVQTRCPGTALAGCLFTILALVPLALASGGCSGGGDSCPKSSGKCVVATGGANGTGGAAQSGGATGSGGGSGGGSGTAGANGTGGSAGTSTGGTAAGGDWGAAGHGELGGAAGSSHTGGAMGAGGTAGTAGAGGFGGTGQRATCGGLTGAACPPSEFCFYNAGAVCGAADQTGVCRMKPTSCPAAETPVCGCDGKTYANMCEAMRGGTSVARDGECPPPAGSVACGGLRGVRCATGQYCRFALAVNCGSGDQTGVCTPVPGVCDLTTSYVCGCDEKTYDNACLAAVALTSVAANGACVFPDGHVCGGPMEISCGAGKYCSYAFGNCGANQATGVCATRAQVCTTESAPVCGCDGQTYSNACFASAAYRSIRSNGACPP